MKVYRKSIGIIPDNEEQYFSMLIAVVESVDELSVMVINKNPRNYQFQITPSQYFYVTSIIKEINKLNNLYGITVDYSKSMKASASIDFFITL
jgi:hypothetical protein